MIFSLVGVLVGLAVASCRTIVVSSPPPPCPIPSIEGDAELASVMALHGRIVCLAELNEADELVVIPGSCKTMATHALERDLGRQEVVCEVIDDLRQRWRRSQ